MKNRLFPLFASFAILALAAVAPAQDRGRRGGGSEGRDRSSPTRSGDDRSRGDRSGGESRSRESRPSRTDDARPSRTNDAPRRDDARPTRNDAPPRDSRPADSRPDRTRDRDSRPTDSRPSDSRPDRTRDRGNDGRGNDNRTNDGRGSDSRPGGFPDRTRDNNGGRDARPPESRDRSRDTRPGDGRNTDGRPSRPGTPESRDRRNPFDRSNGRDDRRPGNGGFGGRDNDRARGGFDSRRARNYQPPSRFDGRGRFDRPVRFGTPPIHSVLGVQIRRTDARRGPDFAFGGSYGGLRVGYVSYGGYRRRSSFSLGFGFGYYAYDPFVPNCAVVASPWYRYSYLPPYIDNTRVIVVNNYPDRWGWDGYRDYDVRSDRRDPAIQDALDDLRDGFEESSEQYASRLVPLDGSVAIYNDGKYDYSLNASDFRDMFLDGVEGSETIRYEIEGVRTRGDEVRLRARHTYEDSWGQEQTVIHTLTLRRDGGRYVIREFGSE